MSGLWLQLEFMDAKGAVRGSVNSGQGSGCVKGWVHAYKDGQARSARPERLEDPNVTRDALDVLLDSALYSGS